MTAFYDLTFRLPMITAYKDAVSTANAVVLQGFVTDETNQNLTAAQRVLFRFHFKLGHLGMSAVQWLHPHGKLGVLGESLAKNISHPNCAKCQFGKQGKTPAQAKGTSNKDQGNLLKSQLKLGDLSFSNKY